MGQYYTYDETFPIIKRLIHTIFLRDSRGDPRFFVSREKIVIGFLRDSDGQIIADAAWSQYQNVQSTQRTYRSRAALVGNMVDMFSKEYDEGNPELRAEFYREDAGPHKAFQPLHPRVFAHSEQRSINAGLQLLLTDRNAPVAALAIHPDGDLIAAGGHDRYVRVWSLQRRRQIAVLRGHSYLIRSLTFNRDGTLLVSSSGDGDVRVWDVSKRTSLHTLHCDAGWAQAVAIHPDERTILTTYEDGGLRIWRTANESVAYMQHAHQGTATCLAVGSNGHMLATGGQDRLVYLWGLSPLPERRRELRGHQDVVRVLAFSPNGLQLASGGDDGRVQLWDVESGTLIATLDEDSEGCGIGRVSALSWLPDEATLAVGTLNRMIYLWSPTLHSIIRQLRGHVAGVNAMVLHPDGRRLISGSFDTTIRIWDVTHKDLSRL